MTSLKLLPMCAFVLVQAQAPPADTAAVPNAVYAFRNGNEQRTVQISRFLIDKYEVTWGDFRKFMEATAYKPSAMRNQESDMFRKVDSKGPRFPVGFVSQEDAIAFCRWKHQRLPTPEEWQLAALGTDRREWPWGAWDPQAANVNTHAVAEVGRFPHDQSPYGAFDMGGNMLEWTTEGSMGGSYATDWQNPTTLLRDSRKTDRDPLCLIASFRSVWRRGLAAFALLRNLDDWVENTGFRCAADAR